MYEYVTVSASSYDPASLATKLNEKSAQGWDVVAIVPTGGDVTAFLRRAGGASDNGAAASESAAPSMWQPSETQNAMPAEPAAAPAAAAPAAAPAEPDPVSEPAGWGMAPESSEAPRASTAPTTVIQTATPYQATSATPAAAASAPSVPAGWYADPAGRFDLRYWDGGKWTEHVARGGQQYTDPPVA